jgi:hypothetical protein
MDQVGPSRAASLDQSVLAGDPRTDAAPFVLLLQLLRDALALAALVIACSGSFRQGAMAGITKPEATLHTRTPNALS